MKNTLIIVMLLSLFVFPNMVSAGIRCGNGLIKIGDSTYQVNKKLEKCGEVLDREVIETHASGTASYDPYSDTTSVHFQENRINKERWWIRVDERGGSYCYPLIFKKGKLIDIEPWERCN